MSANESGAGRPRTGLRRLSLVIGLGIFATVFTNHNRLAKLPLRAIIKDDLGLSPEAMASFFALAGLAWYFKPLAGALSDHMPILGTRRRPYLLLSMLGAALTWTVAAMVPRSYDNLLAAMIALNVLLALANSVFGGLLVAGGRIHGAAGRLSAVRVTVMSAATLLAGPISGWLAGRAFGLTCAVAITLTLTLGVCAVLFLGEDPPSPVPSSYPGGPGRGAAGRLLLDQLRSRSFVVAVILSAAFYASPGFGTVFYYHQKNVLAFSDADIGWLAAINCTGGIFGALCYSRVCRWLSLRGLLIAGITLSAGCPLLYLLYRSWPAALALEGFTGFFVVLGVLPLQHLIVRVSPPRSEAFGHALLLGLGNAAIALSDLLGAALMRHFELDLSGLLVISAAAIAATVMLVPLLPRQLLAEREV